MKKPFVSEYIRARDGSEICSECGTAWCVDGPGHEHDCRYFFIEEDSDDWEMELLGPQKSSFRPAA
jgi:hypothetical protein